MKNLFIIPTNKNVNMKGIRQERLKDFRKGMPRVTTRNGGVFTNKAFYLSSGYDWVLGVDEEGVDILVPLKQGV